MVHVRRRQLITLLLGGAAAAWPLTARAQQSNRSRMVGVLLAMAPDDPEAQLRIKAFEAGLRELGWTEGRNLRLEYRWAVGDAVLLRKQATELVGLAPDLILATSTPVLAALRQEKTLPIVFVQVTDPIGGGFVPNLGRPGGSLTGFTSFEFTIGSKWLEALKHVAPAVTRVALNRIQLRSLICSGNQSRTRLRSLTPSRCKRPFATSLRSSTPSRPLRAMQMEA
jgi:putative tryptophan/tyrosine transport system substrate-binding protein